MSPGTRALTLREKVNEYLRLQVEGPPPDWKQEHWDTLMTMWAARIQSSFRKKR